MESSSAKAGGSTRREATRQKLYEAAVTLIAEQGFSATTVDEIAERAGVAKGTVYYNFASKSVLFEELLRHGVGLLTASLKEAAEQAAREGRGKVDALDAMIRAGLVFIDRYPAFTQLYVAELWRTNRAWQSTLMVVRQEAVAVVEGGRDRRPVDGGGTGRHGPGRRAGLEVVPAGALPGRRTRGPVPAAARTGQRQGLSEAHAEGAGPLWTGAFPFPVPPPGFPRRPPFLPAAPPLLPRTSLPYSPYGLPRRGPPWRSSPEAPVPRFRRRIGGRSGQGAGAVPPPRVGGAGPRPSAVPPLFRSRRSRPIRARTHLAV